MREEIQAADVLVLKDIKLLGAHTLRAITGRSHEIEKLDGFEVLILAGDGEHSCSLKVSDYELTAYRCL